MDVKSLNYLSSTYFMFYVYGCQISRLFELNYTIRTRHTLLSSSKKYYIMVIKILYSKPISPALVILYISYSIIITPYIQSSSITIFSLLIFFFFFIFSSLLSPPFQPHPPCPSPASLASTGRAAVAPLLLLLPDRRCAPHPHPRVPPPLWPAISNTCDILSTNGDILSTKGQT